MYFDVKKLVTYIVKCCFHFNCVLCERLLIQELQIIDGNQKKAFPLLGGHIKNKKIELELSKVGFAKIFPGKLFSNCNNKKSCFVTVGVQSIRVLGHPLRLAIFLDGNITNYLYCFYLKTGLNVWDWILRKKRDFKQKETFDFEYLSKVI